MLVVYICRTHNVCKLNETKNFYKSTQRDKLLKYRIKRLMRKKFKLWDFQNRRSSVGVRRIPCIK